MKMSIFMLETERLCLIPLTAEQLILLADNLPELEQKLEITYQAEPIEGFFKEIILGQAKKAKEGWLPYSSAILLLSLMR